MKRLLTVIIFTFAAIAAWSQVPDEEDIMRKTMNTSSPYYYTTLMMRYNNLERLSIEDYHYLYYGFAYQNDYRPTVSNNALDELYALMPHINVESSDRKELEHLVIVCKEVMKIDPFNLTALNMLVFAHGAMGDKQKEEAYFMHLHGIMETIKASGDGRSEKYPMHIIMFSHAVDVVSSMGMASKRAEIISRNVEYIPLVTPRKLPDGKKIRGFYFDYSRIYRNKPDEVTFTKDRTWQFNGLKPREYK
jgi:hypothetical protein